jgi:hypothetical protein
VIHLSYKIEGPIDPKTLADLANYLENHTPYETQIDILASVGPYLVSDTLSAENSPAKEVGPIECMPG